MSYKVLLASGLAGLTGLYLYSSFSQQKVTLGAEGCPEHTKQVIQPQRFLEIMEELRIHLVPYYTHFYNVVHQMEE